MSILRTLRLGLIGAGQIGQTHLRNYRDLPGVEIVAIADLDPGKARAAASAWPHASVYDDYRALLARDDLEAVDVCLHNNLHRPATVAALESGKHVYCEKPIAATYADGAAMVAAARRHRRMLHVQMGSLFAPATWAARALVDAGRLGDVYHGRCYVNLRRSRPFVDGYGTPAFVQTAQAGGGALIDWGIYAICPVLHLMGNPAPVRVVGRTYDRLPMDQGRRTSGGYDVEEMGTGWVAFENGATLDLLAAWALHARRDLGCAVMGTLGGVELPPLALGRDQGLLKFYHADGLLDLETEVDAGGGLRRFGLLTGNGFAYESPQKHWVAALRREVPLLPTAELALSMILIAEGLYRSHRENREIDVSALTAEHGAPNSPR